MPPKQPRKTRLLQIALASNFAPFFWIRETQPQKGAQSLCCWGRQHWETYQPAGQKSQRQPFEESDKYQLWHGVSSWPGSREAISTSHHRVRPVLPQDKQGWALWPRSREQWVPRLRGEQTPRALQPCEEVLPAGQPSPRCFPVCVTAKPPSISPRKTYSGSELAVRRPVWQRLAVCEDWALETHFP